MVNHELEAGEQFILAQDVQVGDVVHMRNSPPEWKSAVRNCFVNESGYVVLQLENGMDLALGPEDLVAVTRPEELVEG